MFENIMKFFKNIGKKEDKKQTQENSKDAAKERLHLVLMQDRANVSADFLELMKQEIIDVIKKYIEIDEKEIDVRLTNQENDDGTNGAPALYANIPILNIKNDARKISKKDIDEKQESIVTNKSEEKQSKDKEESLNDEKNTKKEENLENSTEKDEENVVEKKEQSEKIVLENNSEKNEVVNVEDNSNEEKEKAKTIIAEIMEKVEKKEKE